MAIIICKERGRGVKMTKRYQLYKSTWIKCTFSAVASCISRYFLVLGYRVKGILLCSKRMVVLWFNFIFKPRKKLNYNSCKFGASFKSFFFMQSGPGPRFTEVSLSKISGTLQVLFLLTITTALLLIVMFFSQ